MRTRPALFAAALAVGMLGASAAQADWRYRHGGWHGPRVHHHHGGAGALGAIIGLGVGVAIGSMLAAPPPPPVYYAPPAPPPGWYRPPPAYYAPPPGYYAPPGYGVQMKPGW